MIEVISPPTLLLLYSHLEEREKELKVSNLTQPTQLCFPDCSCEIRKQWWHYFLSPLDVWDVLHGRIKNNYLLLEFTLKVLLIQIIYTSYLITYKYAWKNAHYQNLLKIPLIPSAGLYQYFLVFPAVCVSQTNCSLWPETLQLLFTKHKFKPVLTGSMASVLLPLP